MESELEYFSSSVSFYKNITFEPDYFVVPWRWNLTAVLVLAVFGIIVNVALLLVIVLNEHMRTIANLLVANLAVADLIMFFFSVPLDIVQWNVISWPKGIGGRALCKICSGVWFLAQVLCVGSLTAVSVERYCTLRWRMHVKRTFFILGVVWLIAILASVPIVRYAHVTHYGSYLSFCYPIPYNGNFAVGFTIAYFVLTYALPVIVISCCYVGMASTLARNTSADTAAMRARRLLAVVVLFLAISFIICWFPLHFINIYFLIDAYALPYDLIVTCMEVGHVLVYVNICLNPLVVFIISGLHRKPLIRLVTNCTKSPTSNQNDPYAQVQEDAPESETEQLGMEP